MEDAEAAKAAGNEAFRAGNLTEAVRCFSQAIDSATAAAGGAVAAGGGDPVAAQHLAVYHSNRSAAYLKQGDGARALADAEACCVLDEGWSKGWGRKGAALLLLGRPADAAIAYKRGMELDVSNADMRRGFLDAQRLATSRAAPPSASPTSAATATGSSSRAAGGGSPPGTAAAGTAAGVAAGGGASLSRLRQFVRNNTALTVLAVLRGSLLACAALYALPVLGAAVGVASYYRALAFHLAIGVGGLYRSHGLPQRTAQYAQNVLMDPVIQSLGMGLIFYMQRRPYVLGLLMVAMPALVQYLWFVSAALSYSGASGALSALDAALAPAATALFSVPAWRTTAVNAKWARAADKAAQWTAQFQVAFGLLLVFELALPRRNFVMLMLYWQLMRMGVMLEAAQSARARTPADGPLTRAFRSLHARILGVLASPRCPPGILSVYGRITGAMAAAVALPDPNAPAAAQRPRCTIM